MSSLPQRAPAQLRQPRPLPPAAPPARALSSFNRSSSTSRVRVTGTAHLAFVARDATRPGASLPTAVPTTVEETPRPQRGLHPAHTCICVEPRLALHSTKVCAEVLRAHVLGYCFTDDASGRCSLTCRRRSRPARTAPIAWDARSKEDLRGARRASTVVRSSAVAGVQVAGAEVVGARVAGATRVPSTADGVPVGPAFAERGRRGRGWDGGGRAILNSKARMILSGSLCLKFRVRMISRAWLTASFRPYLSCFFSYQLSDDAYWMGIWTRSSVISFGKKSLPYTPAHLCGTKNFYSTFDGTKQRSASNSRSLDWDKLSLERPRRRRRT